MRNPFVSVPYIMRCAQFQAVFTGIISITQTLNFEAFYCTIPFYKSLIVISFF